MTLTPRDNDLRILWNVCCPFDDMSPALFEEKFVLEKSADGSKLVIEKDGSRIIGFALGVLREANSFRTGYVKLIAVHPDYRGRGIGSRLLSMLEASFVDSKVGRIRLAESAPNYLVPGLDPRYTRAMVFFERRGYVRFAETCNLTVDLTGLEPHLSSVLSKFDIRRATREDRVSIAQLLETHWSAWKPEVQRTYDNDPISLHVAVESDRIIAFSAYDANNLGTGWFGPMGTDPDYRGIGIGATLLKRCLVDLKSQGLPQATIPWVGPVGFYCRHVDAQVDRVFYRYEKILQ